MGGPENGNFPLLYVVKMSLRRWVGGWFKKAQNTLRQEAIEVVCAHVCQYQEPPSRHSVVLGMSAQLIRLYLNVY